MGQREVLSYLKELRKSGDEDFQTAKSIIESLKVSGMTDGSLRRVRFNLVQLETYGFLEGHIDDSNGHWRRVWRLKKKYC